MDAEKEIFRENELALALVSRYLTDNPRAVTKEMLAEVSEAGGIARDEAYAMLLASLCGLDIADNPAHRALYREYFLRMPRELCAEEYARNSYLCAVGCLSARAGRWELRMGEYAPYEAFVRDDLLALPNGRVIPQIGYFSKRFAFPVVMEDDREWMLVTPNEINTMRHAVRASRGRVLTYGLGLGYFAFMASQKREVDSVTIVERDASVIQLFKAHILPCFSHADKLRIVCADAFAYAQHDMAHGAFDVVFTDLWHDPSDGVPLYLRMKQMEKHSPRSVFLYWIEDTLRLYLPE